MALKEISDIDNHNALMSHVNDDGDHFSCSRDIPKVKYMPNKERRIEGNILLFSSFTTIKKLGWPN
jgi:hypothetical protein